MTWLKKSTLKEKPREVPIPKDKKDQYYHSKYWKNLRTAYITDHPLCERCLKKGFSRPAEEIHHIRPFLTGVTDEDRWDLLLNPNNLMALCERCHHEVHNEMNKR